MSGGTINSAKFVQDGINLTIDDNGIFFTSAAPSTGRQLRWNHSGTAMGYVTTTYSGGVITGQDAFGMGAASASNSKRTLVYNGPSDTNPSAVIQTPTSWRWHQSGPDAGTVISLSNVVTAGCDIYPDASTNFRSLGGSALGWYALYFYDPAQSKVYRLTVTSGNLQLIAM
jgi:hypothetical protein